MPTTRMCDPAVVAVPLLALASPWATALTGEASEPRDDRPPVQLNTGNAVGNPMPVTRSRRGDPFGATGIELWDNGLSFLNGLSHLTEGSRRSVLDDFVVDGPGGWSISGGSS